MFSGLTLSDDPETVTPTVRFLGEATGQVVERRLTPVVAQASAGKAYTRTLTRLVKGPDADDTYQVTINLRVGQRLVSQGDLGTLEVVPLLNYTLRVVLLLGALGALLTSAIVTRRRAVRVTAVLAQLVIAGVFWRSLLGGHTVFLLLVGTLAVVARLRTDPESFLSRGSLVLVLFDELYWGFMVNGGRWTGLVLSGTALALLGLGLGRLVRRPRLRALGALTLATLLTLLYVTTSLYKAFFLDVPAISVAGDAGQVGRLLDSVWLATRPTHLLAAFTPLGMLVAWLVLRARTLENRTLGISAPSP